LLIARKMARVKLKKIKINQKIEEMKMKKKINWN
jgi:hypothetical protein